jgi:hypothetical protein
LNEFVKAKSAQGKEAESANDGSPSHINPKGKPLNLDKPTLDFHVQPPITFLYHNPYES